MPSTSEQVEAFSSDIIKQVEAGLINPLDLKAQMKFIERTLDKIDKGIKENFMKEAAKYGKKFEYKGWKIEETEAGISYDYSSDSVHSELKEKLKAREALLRALKSPLEEVDTTTGETRTLHPPVKKSTTSLKFTAL